MIVAPAAPDAPENPLGPLKYRFRRGSRLAEMPPVPPQVPVPPLSSLDGPFQLAEYLALKVRAEPHNVSALVDAPADITKASERHVWVYEHLRFVSEFEQGHIELSGRIPIDVTPLITQLLHLCNRETCPEMKAEEWQYLCVAHGGEGTDRCCAIDYILHTLDSTSSLLNSSKYFPSRLQIPDSSLSHFPSLFRRLSRIFSHAYFHHREAFATSEAETSLYRRFVALCHKYELVGPSLLIIPQEAYEGITAGDNDEESDARDHDDEDSYDDDDDDEDDDHDDEDDIHDQDTNENVRGRDKDDSGSSGRSHSLGRHSFSPTKWSPMQPATKSKPAPAQESASHSPPSTRAQLDMSEPVIPTTVQGRGTLSRGKGSRGSAANVWAQPAASASTETPSTVPEDVPASVLGMARKESVDSVVHIPTSESNENGSDEVATTEPAVDVAVPRRTPSPNKASLKLDTASVPPAKDDEKSTPTPDDSLATPVPTESPAVSTIATGSAVRANSKSPTKNPSADKKSVLGSSPPKAQTPPLGVSPKSQLTASRPEVLVSPKTTSALLPASPTSGKSELLSVSPKQSPSGKRNRGKDHRPKSPAKTAKTKSSSPSPKAPAAKKDTTDSTKN